MLSVPLDLVPYEAIEGEVVLVYFDRRDVPWLREVIEVFHALVGAPSRELESRLRMVPDSRLLPIAKHVLSQIFRAEVVASVAPRAARATLFVAAATASAPEALRRSAARLGVSRSGLLAALFADLPGERRITAPAASPGPEQVALQCNTAMIRAMMRRAVDLHVTLHGNARMIVRQARLAGLMVNIRGRRAPADGRCAAPDACELLFSGPLSVLAHTTRYGNALAQLVPVLPWCPWFRAEARCRIGPASDLPLRFVLTKGSPIEPGPEPRAFDSKVEARFARELVRATAAWRLIREPEPIEAGESLVFPDFEIRSAVDPARRWWIEIVGFWTAAYLEHKLATLRAAGLHRLLLCVDVSRRCELGPLPEFEHVVWYRRHVDVREVLAIVSQGDASRVK